MPTPTENTVKLAGLPYPLAWGKLALFRIRSIPVEQRNVVGPALLAQIAWCAYKGVQHPFPTWEHVFAALAELSEQDYEKFDTCLASHLPAPEKQAENAEAATTAKEPSDAEKKSNSTASEPLPDAG